MVFISTISILRNKVTNCLSVSRGLSTFNFRESVNINKNDARRSILIENILGQRESKPQNVSTEILAEKLKVDVDCFHSWTYRRRNFLLVRLKSLEDVKTVQNTCGYNLHAMPISSRMLESSIEFSEVGDKLQNHVVFNNSKKQMLCSVMRMKYSNEQLIKYLCEQNSLNNFDIQLRYFLITQLEDILCQGIFSGFQLYPFGSSLAGLGDSGSDLDIVLLHNNLNHDGKLHFSGPEVKSERDQTQLSLSLIADIMRHFVPNFSQVNRILRARVPIVKLSFDLAPVDIDISIELSAESGHHGFIMANYMGYSIRSHPIVKPFFIFLKHWARQHGLVKTIAGNWLSNFQVITLALYFLQVKTIIQPISNYDNSPTKCHDVDFEKISFIHLLYEFFEFLISFNFEKDAISILNGQTFSKPDFSPVYLENPIERDLNICKNVSGVEFKKLLLLAYNSLDAMHCKHFHLADLLDPEYFKLLEKQSKTSR